MQEETEQSSGEEAHTDCGACGNDFIRFTHGATIGLLVEHIMRSETCLALTGAPGSGKSVAARIICQQLLARGVNVVPIVGRQTHELSLRSIAAQLLDKPEADLEPEDNERLFACVTGNDASNRCVMMIDDAETLTGQALEYLRLISSIAKDAAPQLVFIGRPELLSGNDARAVSLRNAVAASWELSPLNPRQAREFVVDTLRSDGLAAETLFDDGGLAALVQHGEGRYGRLVALLSMLRSQSPEATLRDRSNQHWLTAEVVAAVAAQFGAAQAAAPDGPAGVPDVAESAAETESAGDPSPLRLPALAVPRGMPARRRRRVFLTTPGCGLAAAAVLLLAAGGVAIHPRMPDDTRELARFGRGRIAAWLPAAPSLSAAVMAWLPGTIMSPAGSNAAAQQPPVDGRAAPGGLPVSLPLRSPPQQLGRQVTAAPKTHALTPAAVPQETATEANKLAVSGPVPPRNVGAHPIPKPAGEGASPNAPPPQHVAHGPPSAAAPPGIATATWRSPAASSPHVAAAPDKPAAPAAQAPGTPPPAPARVASALDNTDPAGPPNPPHGDNHSVNAVAKTSVGPDQDQGVFAIRLPQPAPGEITLLLSRGDQMLQRGDIATARMFYVAAAEFGVARAAIAAGRTYDPDYLASIQAEGVTADRATAAKWYRTASRLGDQDGSRLASAILAHSAN